jgi:putative nucleotidyltransferase with HDIG domain
MNRRVLAFVVFIVGLGACAIALAVRSAPHTPFNWYLPLLVALTLVSGRFAIPVRGLHAMVSVSEVFVFLLVLLFGPGPATLTVALDGLLMSLRQRRRRNYRTMFNVAEPACSIWIAGTLFFTLAGIEPLAVQRHGPLPSLFVPTIGMTAAFFLLNSVLTAVAVALQNGGSALAVWRRHALSLAVNYYAAASLATLAFADASGKGPNAQVVALIGPLLLLSYFAYREGATRMEQARKHVGELEHLYHATIETLAIAVDAKDQVTHGHIRRVQRHTVAVAKALGVDDEKELKALEAASLLHDIGKLAVPDYILNKPAALNPAEYDAMKLHATKGATILSTVEFPFPVVPIVRHHHEQWDGGGYPDGLAGRQIPIGARVLAVVDCYDAVTSNRPYRRRLSSEEAIGILRAGSGTLYDPAVVEAFVALIPALQEDDEAADDLEGPRSKIAGAPAISPRTDHANPSLSRDMFLAAMKAAGSKVLTVQALEAAAVDACLFTRDSAGDALVIAHATPRIRDAVGAMRLPIGGGLSGWVAMNRHTIVNSDPALDFGEIASALGLHSCTSTPVFALGDLVGVLTVYARQPRRFSPGDARWVGRLAQQIGGAIACPDAPLGTGRWPDLDEPSIHRHISANPPTKASRPH